MSSTASRILALIALLAIVGMGVSSCRCITTTVVRSLPIVISERLLTATRSTAAFTQWCTAFRSLWIGVLGYTALLLLSTLYRSKAETPAMLLLGAAAGLSFALYLTYVREVRAGRMVHALSVLAERHFLDHSVGVGVARAFHAQSVRPGLEIADSDRIVFRPTATMRRIHAGISSLPATFFTNCLRRVEFAVGHLYRRTSSPAASDGTTVAGERLARFLR